MTLAAHVGPELAAAAEAVRAGFPAGIAAVLPPAFAEMLAIAVALEERDGSPRAAQLRAHYLEVMPAQRRAQASQPLLHERLDWPRLPRLSRIVERLYAVLADAGVDGALALGFPDADAFRAASPTLAAIYERTYYGGFMPLLYGAPADMAYATRALAKASATEVIDTCLAAPMLHELSHLGRVRRAIAPLHLDECIAGWLGVHVFPGLAYPEPGEDNAIYATPWFSQLGQALARVVGVRPLVRAHAGVIPWSEAIPARILDGALALYWREHLARRPAHFLADAFRPEPWLALILAEEHEESDFDRVILGDALRAMCLRNHQVELAFRVSPRLPTAVEIDLAARTVTAPPGADGFDPVPLAYFFPPAPGRRLQAMGITGFSLEIADLGAIHEMVSVIMRGDSWHASSSSIRPHRSR